MLTPQLKGKAVSQLTKTNCEEFDLSAFELLAAGEALELAAGLDTAGLGGGPFTYRCDGCTLYTSDAADEEDSVDLGGSLIVL